MKNRLLLLASTAMVLGTAAVSTSSSAAGAGLRADPRDYERAIQYNTFGPRPAVAPKTFRTDTGRKATQYKTWKK